MKKVFLSMLFVFAVVASIAQQTELTEIFRKQFQGRWSADTKYQTNTIEIKFETGKSYATIIDIGSGEAPPVIMRAHRKNNKLIVQPAGHKNDYCELTVTNRKLIFRTQPTIWLANGKPKAPGNYFAETVFKKKGKL